MTEVNEAIAMAELKRNAERAAAEKAKREAEAHSA